jgi:hypothetical protein
VGPIVPILLLAGGPPQTACLPIRVWHKGSAETASGVLEQSVRHVGTVVWENLEGW